MVQHCLEYEQRFLAVVREAQCILSDQNRSILEPLFALHMPIKYKGEFAWMNLYINRGIEEERKATVQAWQMDAGWDRTDPHLVNFLQTVLEKI